MKQRTCIACRKKQDKSDLLRIVAMEINHKKKTQGECTYAIVQTV